MSFGGSVQNRLGVGLISYATLLARRGGGGAVIYNMPSGLDPSHRYQADMSAITVDGSNRLTAISDLQLLANGIAPTISSKTAPEWRTDWLGRKFLLFEGEQAIWLTNALAVSAGQGVTIFAVARFLNPSNNADSLFSLGRNGDGTATTPNTLGGLLDSFSGVNSAPPVPRQGARYIFGNTSGAATPTGTGKNGSASFNKMFTHAGLQVIGRMPRPSASGGDTFWLNEEYIGFSGSTPRTDAGVGGTIGMYAQGNNSYARIALYDLAIWIHPMTSEGTTGKDGYFSYAQGQSVVDAMKTAYGIANVQNTLILDGDSTYDGFTNRNTAPVGTSGVAGDNLNTLAPLIAQRLPTSWRVMNIASGGSVVGKVGSSVTDLTTLVNRRDQRAAFGTLMDIAGGRKVLAFNCQHNDFGEAVGAGRSDYVQPIDTDARADEIYARWQSYVSSDTNSLFVRGFEVIMAVTPFSTGAASGKDVLRGKVRNSNFRSDFNAGTGQTYDGKLRRIDYPVIPSGATFPFASYDASNYFSDQVHWRAPLNVLAATAISTVITTGADV